MKIFLYFIFLWALIDFGISAPNWDQATDETVALLQEYIDIDTSNPPGDVRKAVWWIGKLLDKHSISYETFTVEEDPKRMHLIAEIKGSDSSLNSEF